MFWAGAWARGAWLLFNQWQQFKTLLLLLLLFAANVFGTFGLWPISSNAGGRQLWKKRVGGGGGGGVEECMVKGLSLPLPLPLPQWPHSPCKHVAILRSHKLKTLHSATPPPLPPWSHSLLGFQLLVDRFLQCMHPLSLCPSLFHSCSLSHWFIFNSIFIVLKKLINYCITNGAGGPRVASINWQPPRCVWQPPMQIGVAAGSGDARSAATLLRAVPHATCRSSAARPSMSPSPTPSPSTCSQRPQDVDNDTERGTHYLTTHTHQRMVKAG